MQHFTQQGSVWRFNTKATTINAIRREVEALGYRFYGRTFTQPFGEDIWVDSNGFLAFGTFRVDEDFGGENEDRFYGFSAEPMFGDRSKWIINEPVVAAVGKPPVKVGDVVQVKRNDTLARHEGVAGKLALAVVEHIDGEVMTVVWRGKYANKGFANHAVVSAADAELVLSV